MHTTLNKTKALEAKWLKRCKEWDWNLGLAEIAKELIDEEVENNTAEFKVIQGVFNKYFGGKGGMGGVNSEGIPVTPTMEAIGEILENFTHR
jgi:hypothetical protein